MTTPPPVTATTEPAPKCDRHRLLSALGILQRLHDKGTNQSRAYMMREVRRALIEIYDTIPGTPIPPEGAGGEPK